MTIYDDVWLEHCKLKANHSNLIHLILWILFPFFRFPWDVDVIDVENGFPSRVSQTWEL